MTWRIYLRLVVHALKLYFRVPAAYFWLAAFPVIMLLGLGTVFNGTSDTAPKLLWAQGPGVAAADATLQGALGELGVSLEILAPADAQERWRGGKVPAMLEGQDGHYTVRINSYLVIQGRLLESLVQQGALIASARARGGAQPARVPVVVSSPGGRQGASYAAYLLPGLLGLNLLMMGIFSTGAVDVVLRAKGGYRRLATTPLSRAVYIGAQLTARVIVLIAVAALLLLVGALAFGIANQGSTLALVATIMLGAACFISLGYVLASFARNEEVYNGIANLAFLPLMLLSGVYFSLDSAPAWLQRGADLLPLTPLLKALRAIFNDGAGLAAQAPQLALTGAWTVVLFVCATRRFKWT